MSCSSCVSWTLRLFLQSLDTSFPATARNKTALSAAGARGIRPLHTRSRLRNPHPHLQLSRPAPDEQFLPFVDERSSSAKPPYDSAKSSVPVVKAPGNSKKTNNTRHSGLGPVGQQIKDFQERLSFISEPPAEDPHYRDAVAERTPLTASRSTSARLARKERRRPRTKFEGDRSRLVEQEKRTSSPKAAIARKGSEISEEDEEARPSIEPWGIQKRALREKFAETGWTPRKRLSPDALEGIRALHAQHPDTYTTPVLAENFKVSPEAIRRILKSKWRPNEEEEEERKMRWEKRGENIWSQMTELGIKPPKKWREKGIGRRGDHEAGHGGRGGLEDEGGKHSDQGIITTRVADEGAVERSLAHRIL